jgi:hypothetical protein
MAWDMRRKVSKRRLKIIYTAIKSSGLRGPRYGGSSIWDITWSTEEIACFCLGMGRGCLHLHPLTERLVEAARSATEWLICRGAFPIPNVIVNWFLCHVIFTARHLHVNIDLRIKILGLQKRIDSSTTSIKKTKGDSDAYRRRRIFTTEGHGHTSRSRSWWILIKQACHEPF